MRSAIGWSISLGENCITLPLYLTDCLKQLDYLCIIQYPHSPPIAQCLKIIQKVAFEFLTFLSRNTVLQQALNSQKLAKMAGFWQF